MSRSRKKTPIAGITTATTEKEEKRKANRALRRRTRERLRKEPDAVLPEVREVSNVWAMSKDGKVRFDPEDYPEGMRK